jgi:hypothetical protein
MLKSSCCRHTPDSSSTQYETENLVDVPVGHMAERKTSEGPCCRHTPDGETTSLVDVGQTAGKENHIVKGQGVGSVKARAAGIRPTVRLRTR